MRKYNIPTLASNTGAHGAISAEEVQNLGLHLFDGEEVWPHEARALIDLMQKRLPACAEWNDFIVEALSRYVVDGLEPHGAVDEKNARFLIAMLRRDEENLGELDIALLVETMERAGSAPVLLQRFALEVAQRVRVGNVGPLMHEGPAEVLADAGGVVASHPAARPDAAQGEAGGDLDKPVERRTGQAA